MRTWWSAGGRSIRQGWFPTFRQALSSISKFAPPEVPREWIEQHEPTPHQLFVQRDRMRRQQGGPCFGFLLMDADASPDRINSTIESLLEQTNPNWRLYVVLQRPASSLKDLMLSEDPRIQRLTVSDSKAPPHRLLSSLRAIDADYVGLIDPGDRLAAFALHDCAQHLHRRPETMLLYSDEDQRAASGRRSHLRLKSCWSPSVLVGRNGIGRLWLAHRRLLEEATETNVADLSPAEAEWDLLLQLSEAAGAHVRHLNRCLYHRQTGHEERLPADAGVRVLGEHLRRCGSDVEIVPTPVLRAAAKLEEKPLVSVVIPTRGRLNLISRCVDGLLHDTDYPNIEIILVDNDSKELEVLDYYDRLEERRQAVMVPFHHEFNYSAACNIGARHAKGELLLFLNNDTQVIDAGWMAELVRWAVRPDVGVVGARLLYPNGRIQHAGIALAGPGLVTHLFHGWKGGGDQLFGSPLDYRDCLAVTGACQMIRREVFDLVGGYDESYRLCYSDIAICLAAIEKGWRVLYTPNAVLRHYECQTRGYADVREQEDARKFARLIAVRNLWQDPFLHPDLELTHGLPALRACCEPSMEALLRDRVGQLLIDEQAAA